MRSDRLLNNVLVRAFRVYREDGIAGIRLRIHQRLRLRKRLARLKAYAFGFSAYAMRADFSFGPDGKRERGEAEQNLEYLLKRARELAGNVHFREVTSADTADIEALGKEDIGGADAAQIAAKLGEGWRCFVASTDDRIVASTWIKSGPELYEPFMRHRIRLRNHEVYHWKSYCSPRARGFGIYPMLMLHVIDRLAEESGVSCHYGWVARTNNVQIRTLKTLGFRVVGRVGFVEILGLRMMYLFGKGTFSGTRARVQFCRPGAAGQGG